MRDRATLYLAELGGKAGGVEAVDVQWDLPARNLDKSLRSYLDNGGEAPFSLVRLDACLLASGGRACVHALCQVTRCMLLRR